MKMEFTSGVPENLITEILSLLPAKSLLRLQCLSKLWFALINDPYFINMHFENNNRERSLIVEACKLEERYNRKAFPFYFMKFSNEDQFLEPVKIFPPFYRPKNPNRTKVIGCCNSLVCILNHDREFCISNFDYEIVIWNPSIIKYKILPFEPIDDRLKRFHSFFEKLKLTLAFGYDRVSNDYKVLKIVFVIRNLFSGPRIMDPLQIMVYSLKAHSWRRVEDSLPYNVESFMFWSEPTFSNGAFHWCGNIETRRPTLTLLAFDLTTHKFALQTIPFDLSFVPALEVLEGSLCISINTWGEGDVVWMMKEYGVSSSWSRLYTVDKNFSYRQSLVFSKDGEKVLIMDNAFKLSWYDIKNKTQKTLLENDKHIIGKKFWATSCAESLLLLDSNNANFRFVN